MDLLCHCVSQDCTNCPVYKAWIEGKDPQQIFNEMKQKEKENEHLSQDLSDMHDHHDFV